MAEETDARSVSDELTEVAERIEGDYPESAELLRSVLARLGGDDGDDDDGDDDGDDGEEYEALPHPEAQAVAPDAAVDSGDFLVFAVSGDKGICDCAHLDGKASAFEFAKSLNEEGYRAIIATVVADREAA